MPVQEKIDFEKLTLTKSILDEIKALYTRPGSQDYDKELVKKKQSEITQLYRDERSIFYKDLELSWLYTNPNSLFYQNMTLAKIYCDPTDEIYYRNAPLIEFCYTQDKTQDCIQPLLLTNRSMSSKRNGEHLSDDRATTNKRR